MGIHVSVWGILFYVAVLLVVLLAETWTFWLIMCGAGVELTLLRIMVEQQFFCVFCCLNFLVVFLLFVVFLEKTRLWQTLSVCLMLFLISGSLLINPVTVDVKPLPQHAPEVIARVAGIDILASEIEKPITGSLFKLKRRMYEKKRDELDERIQTKILTLEATEMNVSTSILVSRILSKADVVTDEDIDAFYNLNRGYYSKQQKPLAAIRAEIRKRLQKRHYEKTMEDWIEPMKEKYGVEEYLQYPSYPNATVDIHNNYSIGPDSASVVIVEFSDYMCPSCKRAHKSTNTIRDAYKGKVKWVFKDYPLNRHKGAKKLAVAARSAGEQGKFWEFQDFLFDSKVKPDEKMLISYAAKLGLDTAEFSRGLNDSRLLRAVEKDLHDAGSSGVSSTPTFIINGKMSPGAPSEKKFRQLIDKALAQ